MNIKSLVITDLDYDKNAQTEDDIMESNSTNATINEFLKEALGKSSPTVKELYDWQNSVKSIVVDENICLVFQSKNDHYARTLEEAMLAKLFNVSVLDLKTKIEWTDLRKEHNLKFVIPRNKNSFSIRTIIEHTANNKTDFMYSVILNNYVNEMLPRYIEEGLLWLGK